VGFLQTYGLRLARKRLLLRAMLKRHELETRADRTAAIRPQDILLFSTLRNEAVRLPWFLRYYRDLGVDHFLIVDNGSDDGTAALLADQPDVSVWHSGRSYRRARFGMDWLTGLMARHGHGHWTLVVDPDEFLVYPFCDTRPLRALTDWLDASQVRSFPAMLLDLYPKGPIGAEPYRPGQDPTEIASWFDPGNYTIARNPRYGNLWIQGGPRARTFFADAPDRAPALNKVPLVRWRRSFVYVSSTHMLLPRGLNQVYDVWGGEKASGCLLHAKFTTGFADRARDEVARGEHYSRAREYRAYGAVAAPQPDLWCRWSERYAGWRQLETLGLMSKGNWA